MKKKGFFKGWYFKQEKDGQVIAFIPAFHSDQEGRKSASVQVIVGDESWNFGFPMSAVRFFKQKDTIQIGNCFFSPRGIRVDLGGNGKARIMGRLKFGRITPPGYDICGPLRLMPGMQCRHGIVSMAHRVQGSIFVAGERLSLHGGRGYLEKDWGSSFPDWYFWAQMGWSDKGECSLMAAAADVAFGTWHFPGCIACLIRRGKEYRFATYLGARIRRIGRSQLFLEQGKMRLSVRIGKSAGTGQALRAPQQGDMSRTIREKLNVQLWCRFWIGEKLVCEHVGCGSVEFAKQNK